MDSGQYGEGGQTDPSNTVNSQTNIIESGNKRDNVDCNKLCFENIEKFVNSKSNGESVNSPTQNSIDNEKLIADRHKTLSINRYNKNTDGNQAAYQVYVEHEKLNVGRLHPMKVGRILNEFDQELQTQIIEVNAVGRNRIKILTRTAYAANTLIASEIFKKNSLFAYIPQHRIQKKAVIRNVDTTLTEIELKNIIKSSVPILNVKRMYRKNEKKSKPDDPDTVPRQMVIVTFQGLNMPQFVFIDRVRCVVEPYIAPVIQCYRCMRYGHSSKLCKGKQRCKTCAEEHLGECFSETYCIFCKNNDHTTMSRKCPMYEKQKNIKITMAHANLSFKEAENMVNQPGSYVNKVRSNYYSPLANDCSDFPELPSKSKNYPSPTRNNVPNIRSQNTDEGSQNPHKRRRTINSNENVNQSPSIANTNKHFCGPPINSNPHASSHDTLQFLREIKDKLSSSIKQLVQHFYSQSPGGDQIEQEALDMYVVKLLDETFSTSTISKNAPSEDPPMEL